MATPNRSAGRIKDEEWGRFLAWARWLGLSNTDAQRKLIAENCGIPTGPPPVSRGRHAARSLPATLDAADAPPES